jgi:uracil phosphoribosyltransferase
MKPDIDGALATLCSPEASRMELYGAVGTLTNAALAKALPRRPAAPLLIPILRAGAAMWRPACDYLPDALTAFVVASKVKGTCEVKVEVSTLPALIPERVIILDPIVATGDTILATIDRLGVLGITSGFDIISCYVAPAAFDRVRGHPSVRGAHAAAYAERADGQGYLIPPINGDCGDKLFGCALAR